MEQGDEALLGCNYDGVPVYVPPLKATVTIGHFVVVSTISEISFVAHIIRNHQNHLTSVCRYLPLYSTDTKPYINNPKIRPIAITPST